MKIKETTTLQDILENMDLKVEYEKLESTTKADYTDKDLGLNYNYSDFFNSGITSTSGTTSSIGGVFTTGDPYWTTSWPDYNTTAIRTPMIVTDKAGNHWDVGETLKKICDRLAIIESPNEELMRRFPALKEAYENYKMLEALLANAGEETEDEE